MSVLFDELVCFDHRIICHHQGAVMAGCRVERDTGGLPQVERTIGREAGGGSHCRCEDNRFASRQKQIQGEGGFFECICTMRDDDAINRRVVELCLHTDGELQPMCWGEVAAVERKGLLYVPFGQMAQCRHSVEQRLGIQCSGGVTLLGTRAGNGTAGGDEGKAGRAGTGEKREAGAMGCSVSRSTFP